MVTTSQDKLVGRRRRLGGELRRLRDRAGLSGRDLAEQVGISQAKVSRIEAGTALPIVTEVASWAGAVGASDSELENLKILTDAAYTEVHSYDDALPAGVALQDAIRALEDNCGHKRNYAPLVVPGLLQTAEYTRRLFTLLHVYAEHEIPAVVAARLDRQEALFDTERQFEFLIMESVLRRPLGPVGMMTAQLDRIATLSKFEHVRIGLIPLDSLMLTHVPNGFVIFDGIKDGSDPFVRIETAHASVTARAVGDVRLYQRHWDLLRESAVFDDDARDLLKRVTVKVRKPNLKD